MTPESTTSEEKMREKITTSRRSYIKKFGFGSFGVINVVPRLNLSSTDFTEIVTLRDSDGPVETQKVPSEWWERELIAREVSELLHERYKNEDEIVLVGLSRGEDTISGYLVKQVQIGTRGPRTEIDIPEEVNGIKVEVHNNVSLKPQCEEKDFDPIEGGVPATTDIGGGTACCAAYKGGEEFLMTAAHIFDGDACQSTDIINEPLYQYETFFGDVDDWYYEHDTAFVKSGVIGRSVSNDIVQETAPIKGWVTQDGLATFSSNGTKISGRFASSCLLDSLAEIQSYDNIYDCNPGLLTEIVELDGAYTVDGDSGGLFYFVNDKGNAFVVNQNTGLLINDRTSGAAAYAIEKFQGYTFGN